ncbi:MAG: type I-A CRISPR-associated protein Cas5a [Chitinophagales bacterium]|nr:type I-A CRISPR-associated protein Cas5a [Chitinophagales bacterium]
MRFSAIFKPTSLFSLKSSNATNSGAKSLFLPSPYAIKMAILNQAITVGGELKKLSSKKSQEFGYIRNAQIKYHIPETSYFCVNNSFVKILKPAREDSGFIQTVAFREYIHISNDIEIIFDVEGKEAEEFLKKYLFRINYFGKKGCFFQFVRYEENPSIPNVSEFDSEEFKPGIIEEYDDFASKANFENVDNFSSKTTKREKLILTLPLENIGSSKSFSCYKVI